MAKRAIVATRCCARSTHGTKHDAHHVTFKFLDEYSAQTGFSFCNVDTFSQ